MAVIINKFGQGVSVQDSTQKRMFGGGGVVSKVISAAKPITEKLHKAFFTLPYQNPKNVIVGGSVPFSPVSGLSAAGAAISSGGRFLQGIKKIGSYVGIGKPQTIKQIGINIAKFGGAYTAGTYAATGELPKPSLRTLAGYAGAQLNLPATFFGAIHGLGTKAYEGIITNMGKTQIPAPFSPIDYFKNNQFPDFSGMKMPETNITMPATNVQMPSYSPSLSVGGGGGSSDILPLLLLLLGGGAAAGYVLGRKKRKKKYKKRKRR
jgi:hypothetical protein